MPAFNNAQMFDLIATFGIFGLGMFFGFSIAIKVLEADLRIKDSDKQS